MTKDQLERKVLKLERRVAELEERTATHLHIHTDSPPRWCHCERVLPEQPHWPSIGTTWIDGTIIASGEDRVFPVTPTYRPDGSW